MAVGSRCISLISRRRKHIRRDKHMLLSVSSHARFYCTHDLDLRAVSYNMKSL